MYRSDVTSCNDVCIDMTLAYSAQNVSYSLLFVRLLDSDPPHEHNLESPVYRVIDELRDQIFQRFPDVITADAKYLAYLFTEVTTNGSRTEKQTNRQTNKVHDESIAICEQLAL